MEDNGQASTEAPGSEMDQLVGLLLSDPAADAADERPEPSDGVRLTPAMLGNRGELSDPRSLDNELDDGSQSDPGEDGSGQVITAGQVLPDNTGNSQQGRTFKVSVKGDDGADQTIEVNEKERAAGYLRHADFTRKTMELADQRRKVMELADNRMQTAEQAAMQEIQRSQALIIELAQIPSPQQLAHLAATDPAKYPAEHARVEALKAKIAELDGRFNAWKAAQEQRQKQHLEELFRECWANLTPDGIDKPKLEATFTAVQKLYGIPADRFEKINDPKLIRMMIDAVAFRDLKAKAAGSAKEALANARRPQLPAQRQTTPQATKQSRALNGRFDSKRGGSIRDLGAYIDNLERRNR